MTHHINLQNTPTSPSIKNERVRFVCDGEELAGTLFTPANTSTRLPAVVITGAWTTVKEQMAGTYARELAARGFAALVFDFTGWGESAGERRFREDPVQKTRDINAAIEFLSNHPSVDSDRIGGVGVCASSGYMAAAAADHPGMKRLALVAPWLHTPTIAREIYGGADAVNALIETSRAADRSEGGEQIEAASATNEASLMFQAPYYTEPHRGLISEYDNKFDLSSWEPWLTYDAHASADRLTAPLLVVCSEAAALPAGAHEYIARTNAPVSEHWLEGVTQFDFYDVEEVIKVTVASISAHLQGDA